MRRTTLAACTGAVLLLLVFCGVASAATYTVDDPSDLALADPAGTGCVSTASTCTLRAAVQAADNSGGASTITLPANTYPLSISSLAVNDPTTGDLDITGSASVTITGAGQSSTFIDSGAAADRSFAVDASSGSLTLSGVTVRNGSPSANSTSSVNGGAIYSGGTLHLLNDTFDGNQALGGNGGAVDQDGTGALTVQGTTFTNNQGGAAGGAISDSSTGALTVIGDRFGLGAQSGENQVGEDGGAIADDASSSAVISDSTFTGNRTQASSFGTGGGALYLNGASYELDRDEFDSNVSVAAGGAIDWFNGALTGRDDAFVADNAVAQGGAIYAFSTQPLSLTDTTLTDNPAQDGGGLYFAASTPVELVNDTLYDNSAGRDGSAVYGADGLSTWGAGVQNTIFGSSSTSGNGTLCANASGADAFPSGVDLGHNLSTDSSCLNPAGNLLSQALTLGTPSDSGGSVLTEAEPVGAASIDAGTNAVCPTLDARGTSRPQGTACDVGAYEFVPPPSQPTTSTATTTVSATTTVAAPTTTTTVTAPPPTTPPGTPPSATTRGAMGITPNSAFLGGTVDPRGVNTSYSFQVGTTRNYGLNTVSGHTDTGPLTIETRIGGLKPGTTYHYRLVATSAAGTTRGTDRTFKTAPAYNGRVALKRTTLTVHGGKVALTLRCASTQTCQTRVGLTVPITLPHTHKAGTLLFTRSSLPTVTIRAHKTVTVSAPASAAALTLIGRAAHHRLSGTLVTRPVTAQPATSTRVTLVLR